MDSAIKKAEQEIEYLSSDEETMKIYWERERSLHERANMISSAEERKSIENAINFLKLGVDIETVSKGTGISIEKVKELYNNLSKGRLISPILFFIESYGEKIKIPT